MWRKGVSKCFHFTEYFIYLARWLDSGLVMGAGSSRERLSRADMEFLLLHTHYDEKTIQGRDTLQIRQCIFHSQFWRDRVFLSLPRTSIRMILLILILKLSLPPEWYKGFMSDCPEGKLNTESFMKIYSKCFPQGNAAEFCDHVFRWEVGTRSV